MRFLALTLPDGTSVSPPPGIPSNSDLIFNIPQFIVTVLIVGVTLLSLIMLIFSGIQWITSQGDPKAIEGARKRITYAIIGLVVSLAAFIIVSVFLTLITGDSNSFNIFNIGNFSNSAPCGVGKNAVPC